MSKTLKVDVKYKKARNGFDFKLSISSELNIFQKDNFNSKNLLNHVIKLGVLGFLAYFLNVISSGV